MAVPVRAELLAFVIASGQRLYGSITRTLSMQQQRLKTAEARLGNPGNIIAIKMQQLDHATHRLLSGFDKLITHRNARVTELAAMLRHPRQVIAEKSRTLILWDQRLASLKDRLLQPPHQRVERAAALLEAFSLHNVLTRGFAVVRDEAGRPVTSASAASDGLKVDVEFHDGRKKGTFGG
jgi:exodeoxyribonuclease VII large subunit